MKHEQTARLAGMLEWLTAHPHILDRLCRDTGEVDADAIQETITALHRQEYYELLLLFIIQNQSHPDVSHASAAYVGRKMAALLRQDSLTTLTDEFLDLLFERMTGRFL